MSGNPITIRNLGPEDAHVLDRVRPGTFDGDLDPSRAWAFLATRVNELVVALDQGEVVGFVYGTTLMRPDKPTEFFVNEISVHSDYERITDLAIDRGCEGLWVMADAENGTARSVYKALGGQESGRAVMFDWPL